MLTTFIHFPLLFTFTNFLLILTLLLHYFGRSMDICRWSLDVLLNQRASIDNCRFHSA
ncbi:Uncharacterized protein APZ42_029527 [Daphnia magna]|uniref:Uncharacterized protein n=1 Tax=Daphnia magna TaxID=35525 RepID=A0A164PNL1_9CRUS|nr:Uncharacterized protein APZ42_029527 [Daphnia magna]